MGKERERAEAFARRLADAYGTDLVLVLLYGSAARGDYREGVSDLNLLVVVRELDAAALRRGTALAREWVTERNPPPLMLSEAEWLSSADVFAIEYSDMRDAHVVLHGTDPFGAVRIHWRDLRLQTERELKSKKIQLRERYLFSADAPDELGRLLMQSFPTFLTLFRSALRLAGAEVPRDPERVIDAVAERSGLDPQPLREVLRARREGTTFEPKGDSPVATGYLAAITTLSAWSDRLSGGDAPAEV